jgi:hypothetical protein
MEPSYELKQKSSIRQRYVFGLIIFFAIVFVCGSGAGFWFWGSSVEREVWEEKCEILQGEKDTLAADLASTEGQLQILQSEKDALVADLASAEGELQGVQDELSHLKDIYPPKNFPSLKALKDWLAQDDTDSHEYIEGEFDCDDFALMLQQHAFEDGYKIDMQYSDNDDLHAMNSTIIGNYFYFIEPQSDRVTRVGRVD